MRTIKSAFIALLLLYPFKIVICAQNTLTLSTNTVDKIIKSMSLHEKAMLLVGTDNTKPHNGITHYVPGSAGYTCGIERFGIPATVMADGPVGVRISPIRAGNTSEYYCTAFPSSTLLASTWDTDLTMKAGRAMANEAKEYGVDILLTPGINIMRNPLCGRNFEYLSEDPVLSGKIGAAIVNGIQSTGVAACVKHFIANNQQTNKLNNDARIPQRALREIYLKNFEICIKESSPWTIMSSYNKIGGIYTQANYELLRTVLRKEWKYKGTVITDWYKKRNTTEQVHGGSNLMMPGEISQIEEIENAVKKGILPEEDLNKSVKYVLEYIVKTLSFKRHGYSDHPDLKKNADISREVATQGMVLLKNKQNILPITKIKNISLFGASAYASIAGGTGSSNVNKPYIVDISTGLENAGFIINPSLKNIYDKYRDFQNTLLEPAAAKNWERLSYFRPVLSEMDIKRNKNLVSEQAEKSDMAVIVIGRGSGEESDRTLKEDFYLTDTEQYLIKKVCDEFHAKNKKVILILNICGVIETTSWKNLPDAILLAWFPGQECGNAIADVLTGKVNPSGKLPMTFPCSYDDIPSSKNFPIVGKTFQGKNFDYTDYEEGIWIGYRYFLTARKKVSYPFGYGLSYTHFTYSRPVITKRHDKWEAEVEIKNNGKVPGKEVVQLYISAPRKLFIKPTYELKGFCKTKLLMPGESQIAKITFSDYDIASFHEESSSWIENNGDYKAMFGDAVDNIKTSIPFSISRTRIWKVNQVLAPVKNVKTIDINAN